MPSEIHRTSSHRLKHGPSHSDDVATETPTKNASANASPNPASARNDDRNTARSRARRPLINSPADDQQKRRPEGHSQGGDERPDDKPMATKPGNEPGRRIEGCGPEYGQPPPERSTGNSVADALPCAAGVKVLGAPDDYQHAGGQARHQQCGKNAGGNRRAADHRPICRWPLGLPRPFRAAVPTSSPSATTMPKSTSTSGPENPSKLNQVAAISPTGSASASDHHCPMSSPIKMLRRTSPTSIANPRPTRRSASSAKYGWRYLEWRSRPMYRRASPSCSATRFLKSPTIPSSRSGASGTALEASMRADRRGRSGWRSTPPSGRLTQCGFPM